MKKIMLFLVLFISTYINAQNELSLSGFRESSTHWYKHTNTKNIITPTRDQAKYVASKYESIAENILLFQRDNGGWMKNYDVTVKLTQKQIDTLIATKSQTNTTFDNGTTYTHIQYLARVYEITKADAYKQGCLKGLEFILNAQYANGGWPQYFPLRPNYSHYITFNDGATIGIMDLFKDIIDNKPVYDFIDSNLRSRIAASYQRGLDCILKLQLKDNGNLTVWAQQYDESTFTPIWGRSYEPPALSNKESADILILLMTVDNPSKEVKAAIQGGVKWINDSKILDTELETFDAPEIQTEYLNNKLKVDRRVVSKKNAPAIWSEFYDINTKKPLFCNRDKKLVNEFEDLTRERRAGYSWYTYKPTQVLQMYEAWKIKNKINN